MFDQINNIRNKIKEIYELFKNANKSLASYGDAIVTEQGEILDSENIDEKFSDIDLELSNFSTTKNENKLRVVYVYKYRKKANGTWDRKFQGQGVLHGFGLGYREYEEKSRHFSSAIVEMADGEVLNVDVTHIKFVNPLLKKEVKPELSEEEENGIKEWAGAN